MGKRQDYWKWDENSWNLWRKSAGICRKMKDPQNFKKDFHPPGKIKKPTSKALWVRTKNEESFENFQENIEIFWSNSVFKIYCFHIFTKYFLDFWLLRKYITLKDSTRFLQQLFRFRVGGVPAFPSPDKIALKLEHFFKIHASFDKKTIVEWIDRIEKNHAIFFLQTKHFHMGATHPSAAPEGYLSVVKARPKYWWKRVGENRANCLKIAHISENCQQMSKYVYFGIFGQFYEILGSFHLLMENMECWHCKSSQWFPFSPVTFLGRRPFFARQVAMSVFASSTPRS